MKQGLGCRVGNGQTIKILEDPWLPVEHDPYIYTRSESLQDQKVSSLIGVTSNCWNADLVDNRDAIIILTIPLNSDVKDSWYR